MSNTVAPPLSLLAPMASRRWPKRLRRKVFRLALTQPAAVSAWQELVATLRRRVRAPIDGAVGKHAEVRNVCVFNLPESVGVEVKAVVASNAMCELVVVDFLSAGAAESVKVRHGDGLAAEHEGHTIRGVEVSE
eukprot:6192788-Pleurochrysis_carterae.AAC.1